MKEFNIPVFYRSAIVSKLKHIRRLEDPKKQNFNPFLLDFGSIKFYIPRHFGFCYGVENAIEIAYKTIEKNTGKNIFLLSEIIHNPLVNQDLIDRGVRFIMNTQGKQIIHWNEIKSDDIVIIPAFGTTIEIENQLKRMNINIEKYNTTCPFVEKVWKSSARLGKQDYTIIIHGKSNHEETRATFSQSEQNAHTLIIRDIKEAHQLANIILNKVPTKIFYKTFQGKYSQGFDPEKHLEQIGIINQTTMLATETLEITNFLKNTMIKKYGKSNYKTRFADTRNTLCYATNDNQNATYQLLENQADLALVIGGYNSSNTSHIVELCSEKLLTYFISSKEKILNKNQILHFSLSKKIEILEEKFLPNKKPIIVHITAGASCPDIIIDEVMQKLLSFYPKAKNIEDVMNQYNI